MDVLMVEVIESSLMAAHCRSGMERELSPAGRIYIHVFRSATSTYAIEPFPDAKHINLPSTIMIIFLWLVGHRPRGKQNMQNTSLDLKLLFPARQE